MCIRFALAGELRRAKTVCSRFGTEQNFEAGGMALDSQLLVLVLTVSQEQGGLGRYSGTATFCTPYAIVLPIQRPRSRHWQSGTGGDEWIRRLISTEIVSII